MFVCHISYLPNNGTLLYDTSWKRVSEAYRLGQKETFLSKEVQQESVPLSGEKVERTFRMPIGIETEGQYVFFLFQSVIIVYRTNFISTFLKICLTVCENKCTFAGNYRRYLVSNFSLSSCPTTCYMSHYSSIYFFSQPQSVVDSLYQAVHPQKV